MKTRAIRKKLLVLAGKNLISDRDLVHVAPSEFSVYSFTNYLDHAGRHGKLRPGSGPYKIGLVIEARYEAYRNA